MAPTKRPPRTSSRPQAPSPEEEKEAPRGESATNDIPSTPPPPTEKRRTPSDRKLIASISGTYQTLGMGIIAVGMNREDQGLIGSGGSLAKNADAIADAWIELADKNPAVKKALQRFTEASAAGTLIAIHFACFMPLLADRGVVPPAFVSVANMNGSGNVGD